MKGPGGRMRFDLRRVWDCPICHRRDWTTGDVVFRACTCAGKNEPNHPVWMKLIEEEPAPVPQPPADLQAPLSDSNLTTQCPPTATLNGDQTVHQPEALPREEKQDPIPADPR